MSFKNSKRGEGSSMLIFVVLFAIGAVVLILFLARSPKFQQAQLNVAENQDRFNEQLLELGERGVDTQYQDGRIVLDMNLLNKFDAEICNSELDFSSPESTEAYKDKKKGIEFSFPYNSTWGNAQYTLNTYDEMDGLIYFGPLKNFSKTACNISRAYSMEVHAIRPTTDILVALEADLAGVEAEFVTLLLAEAIKYVKVGSDGCKSPAYYVLGIDGEHDYEFSAYCSDDIENDFVFLEQIINTIKFH